MKVPRRPSIAPICALALALCAACGEEPIPSRAEPSAPPASEAATGVFAERSPERETMVARQIAARGVTDERVLAAMRRVPRHAFVPPEQRHLAYADHPLPIGLDQTISQPFIVAWMTELLELAPAERVLEIGTGSGYQAAVLAELTPHVFTIEIVRPLGERAARTLVELGYDTVAARIGDGYAGWPEAAPFDAIVVTAAPGFVPPALIEQLAPGGRLVIPVGEEGGEQDLTVIVKQPDGSTRTEHRGAVRFVPMTGEARDGKR